MFKYDEKDWEAVNYLEERDKKHIFEILEMLERRINTLEKDTKGRELFKSLIDTYSHVCELADDYPSVKLQLIAVMSPALLIPPRPVFEALFFSNLEFSALVVPPL